MITMKTAYLTIQVYTYICTCLGHSSLSLIGLLVIDYTATQSRTVTEGNDSNSVVLDECNKILIFITNYTRKIVYAWMAIQLREITSITYNIIINIRATALISMIIIS